MTLECANSGLKCIGSMSWGTHFCQFYESGEDLRATLAPYVRAGLENNEGCLWVTSPPFARDDATAALRAEVPDLDERMKRGQVEILDYRDWYLLGGAFDPDRVTAGWFAKTEEALNRGFAGLRIAANTFWLAGPDAYKSFTDYERRLNVAIADHRLICLCSYGLSETRAGDVLDVVRAHEFALARREGEWEVVEAASLKTAKDRLARANEDLERIVSARTAHLRNALADKEVLLREVHHRVKNNLQLISSLILLKRKELASVGAQPVLDDLLRRINAISLVHETLYLEEDSHGIDVSAYLGDLVRTLVASYGLDDRVEVRVASSGGFLGLTEAVPVSLIATEVITNALRSAFSDTRRGLIEIAFDEVQAGPVLTIKDVGVGMPCDAGRPAPGIGTALVDKLVAQVSGRVAYDCDGGTTFTLRFPPPA